MTRTHSFPHSTAEVNDAEDAASDPDKVRDALQTRLFHLIASIDRHHPLKKYRLLHEWCCEALVQRHGAAGDLHTHNVAGLCLATAWHTLDDHDATDHHKVDAIEHALSRHFGLAQANDPTALSKPRISRRRGASKAVASHRKATAA